MERENEQAEQTEQTEQPLKPPQREKGNAVIPMQMLACVLLLAALLVCRHFAPEQFSAIKANWNSLLAQSDFPVHQEIIRFTGSFVQNRLIPCLGAGGEANPQQPENYSQEAYLPENRFSSPLQTYQVSSEYGWRSYPLSGEKDFHTGIDLATAEGECISAVADGVVLQAKWSNSYGNYLLLAHQDGTLTRYCHMEYVFVRVGQTVTQGQCLGTVGSTGDATGPHLHFELLHQDTGYDPSGALGL